jgi:hypothetical protein
MFENSILVKRLRLSLFDAHSTMRTNTDAESRAIAKLIFDNMSFSISKLDSSLCARAYAGATAHTAVFINMYYFSNYSITQANIPL